MWLISYVSAISGSVYWRRGGEARGVVLEEGFGISSSDLGGAHGSSYACCSK